MADRTNGARELSVRGVHAYFKLLEGTTDVKGANALEAFLAACDARGLTLGVGRALFQLGHEHLPRPAGAGPFDAAAAAAGPDCPACPRPPGA